MTNNDWRSKLQTWLDEGNSPTISDELRALRAEFVAKFPPEKLRDLTLEEYALGHDKAKDSFCYWLEAKTGDLGSIWGGSSRKFGVYWSRADNDWRYNKIYKDAEDARKKLMNGIASLVEAAQEKRFEELDAIGRKLLGHQRYSMRVKPLSLYCPDDILPISSLNHLKHFLEIFGQTAKGEVIALNRYLLAFLKSQKEFESFDTFSIMYFLYDAFPPPKEEDSKTVAAESAETEEEPVMKISPRKKFPLNQILYGPPGTGKTYATIRRAVEIVEPEFGGDFKTRFDELMDEGRIAFVTFHQSFAYEDFVEGIRPSLEGEGTARYELRDGILKEIALRALGNCLELARPGEATFDDVWDAFIEKVENETEWLLPGLWFAEYKVSLSDSGSVRGLNIKGDSKSTYYADRQKCELVWIEFKDKGQPANRNDVKRIVGVDCHTHLIGAIVEELKRLRPSTTKSTSEKPSTEAVISFLKGSKEYRLKNDISQTPRFVLIIDEINRGNISKILGELITLLEDDKRLPGENSLKVTLPYSGDKFALPANLYILGTMNTADKSLALVDVALRRRFVFEELAPDFTVCELSDAERNVLQELNHRITLRKDREHRIGHSYFMKLESKGGFNEVFRQRVIPLLQEYFFNDWDGLRFVLGESGKGRFVRELQNKAKAKEARNRWQWWFDENPDEKGDCLNWLVTNYKQEASDE